MSNENELLLMEQRWPLAYVHKFVRESRAIEGIFEPATSDEVGTVQAFLASEQIDRRKLRLLVTAIQPGAKLRDAWGMNVRIGDYTPPPGGQEVLDQLKWLIHNVNNGVLTPYEAHIEYEMIHPFTDGNGRSGRVLWLWVLGRPHHISFLQQFYYDTLADNNG